MEFQGNPQDHFEVLGQIFMGDASYHSFIDLGLYWVDLGVTLVCWMLTSLGVDLPWDILGYPGISQDILGYPGISRDIPEYPRIC